MNDPQDTPWWIRPDLGNDAGSMDWRTPTRHRHDLRVDADEFDRYNAARRVTTSAVCLGLRQGDPFDGPTGGRSRRDR